MDAQGRLIGALIERQRNLKEGDLRFARRLGMSRTMWHFLRNGQTNLSLPIVRGILAAYPELTPQATALLFLASDAKKITSDDEDLSPKEAVV